MAKLLKLRRGTTTQHSSFTGAEGEVTVDTDKDTLVVHDGSTAGGIPLAKESALGTFTTDVTFDGETADRDITFDRSENWLKFNDDTKAVFGTTANTTLFHNGTDLYIQNGSGDIRFQPNSGEDSIYAKRNGAVELWHGNGVGTAAKTFETTSSGITITNSATAGVNFTNTNNTPELQFRSNSVDSAGEIKVNESTGGGSMSFSTKTTGGTLTNALELGTKQESTFAGAIYTPATAVSALDIDCSTGNYFTKTINANSTFTFSNPAASGTVTSFTLELTHTSGTVTWPTEVKWNDDTAPTLTAGKTHLFMFVTDDGGSRWRGSALVDYVN